MSEMGNVLSNLSKTGRLSGNDKRWLTQKIAEEREHEIVMNVLRCMQTDPEFKYFVGAAGSFGIAGVGALMTGWGVSRQRNPYTSGVTGGYESAPGDSYMSPSEYKVNGIAAIDAKYDVELMQTTYYWADGSTKVVHDTRSSFTGTGSVGALPSPTAPVRTFDTTFHNTTDMFATVGGLMSGDVTGGIQSMVGNTMKLGGLGFGGFCCTVLILKAVFNGTDLGELLQGIGEIVPL